MTTSLAMFAAGVFVGWFLGLATPLICEVLFDRFDKDDREGWR